MANKLQVVFQEAIDLARTLPTGAEAYIVGGAARDYFMCETPGDMDIEVFHVKPADLIEWAKRIDPKADVFGKSFGVITLTFNGKKFDAAIPRRESKTGNRHTDFEIESDPEMSTPEAARRRDFTMNSIMIRLSDLSVVDWFNGVRDIYNLMLIPTSEEFDRDPLRVLRGVQFAGRFGFGLSATLIQAGERLAPQYQYLSKDRIWGEWYKWATKSEYPSNGLQLLNLTGWDKLVPYLGDLINIPQNELYHPEGSVWEHTLLTCDTLEVETRWRDSDADSRAVLMFAALCHDFGKITTTETDAAGEIHSHGHEKDSEWMSREFMSAIGAPNDIIERVATLCKQHMRKPQSPKSILRLAHDLSPYATMQEWAALGIADTYGVGPGGNRDPLPFGLIMHVAEGMAVADAAPAPLIMGRHLIALGLKPSPKFGVILREAMEAQLDGEFDAESAGEWLSAYLTEKGKLP